MKREIKFRAWDESQRYMAYQGTPDLETIQSFMFHFGDKKLMQFTGLQDKSGVDVYEDDYIENDHGKVSIVKFIDGCFMICNCGNKKQRVFTKGSLKNKIVISNIYEYSKYKDNTKKNDIPIEIIGFYTGVFNNYDKK